MDAGRSQPALRQITPEDPMPFATIDGARIHYEADGAGHPVIFIHGHGLDHRMWREQVAAIGRGYTVVRYDMRGHGASEAPPTGYSRPHYAEELYGLVEALGFTKPSLVGHSLGGSVAIEYALRHPDRVTTLSLVDSGLEGYAHPVASTDVVAKQRDVLRAEGISAKFLRAALISPLFDGIRRRPELLALVREMLAAWSGASWLETAAYEPPERTQIERLDELRLPVLVTFGEHDTPPFQEVASILTQRLPMVRKAPVPDAGHLAPLENPEPFNDILLDFLGGACGKALI